jgi:TetR/AcrR family transcriptional regulator, transcriptional repressor for nem operon
MSRASRADAAKHRDEVVNATARLLRERGAAATSVQDVMSAAGLTHGGFYKHFGSKDELVGVAADAAFAELLQKVDDIIGGFPDAGLARPALAADYLSAGHRDDPGSGCANAGLAADAARSAEHSPLRRAYGEGFEAVVARLTEVHRSAGRDASEARQLALVYLATTVGALTLARATAGSPVSDEILDAARLALTSSSAL